MFMRINDDDDITDGTGLAEHRADGRSSCVRVVAAAVERHVALLLNLDFGRHRDHTHDRLDRRCNQPSAECIGADVSFFFLEQRHCACSASTLLVRRHERHPT